MKYLILLVFILPLSVSASFKYLEITTLDDKVITGQWINDYQDNWFTDLVAGPQYTAIFSVKYPEAKMQFVPHTNIKSISHSYLGYSLYTLYHASNNIMLKNAPLKDWNFVSTGNDGHHVYENLWGNFAWDIEKLQNGLTYKAKGEKNSDYYVWGEDIYSPVDGEVYLVENSLEDYPPETTRKEDLTLRNDGNLVMLKLKGTPFYMVFLHLKKGSIPSNIKKGYKVSAGEKIAQVGNSGRTFLPHLHMTMYAWSITLNRFISVPSFFQRNLIQVWDLNERSENMFYSPEAGQSIR